MQQIRGFFHRFTTSRTTRRDNAPSHAQTRAPDGRVRVAPGDSAFDAQLPSDTAAASSEHIVAADANLEAHEDPPRAAVTSSPSRPASEEGQQQQQQREEEEEEVVKEEDDKQRQTRQQSCHHEGEVPAFGADAEGTRPPMLRPKTPGFPSWDSDCASTASTPRQHQEAGNSRPSIENPFLLDVGGGWQHEGEVLDRECDQTAPQDALFVQDAPDLMVTYGLGVDMAIIRRSNSMLDRLQRPTMQQLNLAMAMPMDLGLAGSSSSSSSSDGDSSDGNDSSGSSNSAATPSGDADTSGSQDATSPSGTLDSNDSSSSESEEGMSPAFQPVLLRSLSSSSLAPLPRCLATPEPVYWGKGCPNKWSTATNKLGKFMQRLVSPSASCRTSAASSEDVVVWVDTNSRKNKNTGVKAATAAAKKAWAEATEALEASCSRCGRMVRKTWRSAGAQVREAGRVCRRAFV